MGKRPGHIGFMGAFSFRTTRLSQLVRMDKEIIE